MLNFFQKSRKSCNILENAEKILENVKMLRNVVMKSSGLLTYLLTRIHFRMYGPKSTDSLPYVQATYNLLTYLLTYLQHLNMSRFSQLCIFVTCFVFYAKSDTDSMSDLTPVNSPPPQQSSGAKMEHKVPRTRPRPLTMDSVDTFTALQQALAIQAMEHDEWNAFNQEEGLCAHANNWGLPIFASKRSDSARSDSVLGDEDWIERQHRARQVSLAGTFADALTISAPSTVKQKVQNLIGTKVEKWEPPKYDITPDHGDILQPKISHQQRAQRERTRHEAVHRKPGPVEIGRMNNFKMPTYVNRARAGKVNWLYI